MMRSKCFQQWSSVQKTNTVLPIMSTGKKDFCSVSLIGRALDVNPATIVVDHEILSTVIHTVHLHWHVQMLSVPCKSKGN
jgi:hypothetical protein